MSGSPRNGFTLLEAVVALAILGMVSVAGLATVSAELRSVERSHRLLEASALAKDRLARVRVLTAQEIATLPDSLQAGTFAAPFSRYRWSAVTSKSAQEDDLYDVVVIVEWQSGSYRLASRVYRPLRTMRSRL